MHSGPGIRAGQKNCASVVEALGCLLFGKTILRPQAAQKQPEGPPATASDRIHQPRAWEGSARSSAAQQVRESVLHKKTTAARRQRHGRPERRRRSSRGHDRPDRRDTRGPLRSRTATKTRRDGRRPPRPVEGVSHKALGRRRFEIRIDLRTKKADGARGRRLPLAGRGTRPSPKRSFICTTCRKLIRNGRCGHGPLPPPLHAGARAEP